MGKKAQALAKRKRDGDIKTKEKLSKYPTVSVCTPTYNRRPFIPQIITCFLSQDYPMDKIEWIVVDDGTDKVKDLFEDVQNVKYYEVDEKMPLGKKRNYMHSKATGDILVYMDDDDYYPPCRISHAVSKLLSSKQALCAGSSEIYLYFKHIQKMYQFGPYGPNHATAGTFAFHRKLLDITAYEEEAALAEEKAFLKNYSIPFVQLDPMKTILVFSHIHNTYDKKKLLVNPHPDFVKESAKTVSMFVKSAESRKFFLEDIDDALANYEPGCPEMKPDVMKQIEKMEADRERELESMKNGNGDSGIVIQQPGQEPRTLSQAEALQLMQQQQQAINELNERLQAKEQECVKLRLGIMEQINQEENPSNIETTETVEVDSDNIIEQINSEN
tara:strand:+ start:41 stop:1201 length:1161 start_codon:yes stop_codon:yes gene_type:complete